MYRTIGPKNIARMGNLRSKICLGFTVTLSPLSCVRSSIVIAGTISICTRNFEKWYQIEEDSTKSGESLYLFQVRSEFIPRIIIYVNVRGVVMELLIELTKQ